MFATLWCDGPPAASHLQLTALPVPHDSVLLGLHFSRTVDALDSIPLLSRPNNITSPLWEDVGQWEPGLTE